jgi:large-conductance mechanosensitive channel
MNTRTIINRTVILSVFVIAGYLLARSLYYGSFIGVVLAFVAIGAWAMFLHQLNKLQAKEDAEAIEELPGSY